MSDPTPMPAASVLLLRGANVPEIYFVHRSPRLRFLGGFHAFPGGKVDTADADCPDGSIWSPQRRAAVRELFEEVGILLAPGWVDQAGARRELLDNKRSFTDLLPFAVDPERIPYAGSLITPPFSPLRFDTAFFVANCPEGQIAEVWPGELESGVWLTARAALAAWNVGDMLLSPPTVTLLRALDGKASDAIVAACLEETARVAVSEITPLWFSPAVRMIPLRTPALPPAAFTNAFLVGTGPRYLIDPGATDPSEQARLFRILDEEQTRSPLTAVVLTHHHIDHIGSAMATAERYNVPILAHADAAERLQGEVTVTRHLEDECVLDLGESPAGGRLVMRGLLTPGHAPGHLAFHLPQYGLLLAGDMVSTLSSVLVAPPDGNLRTYLASLRRLLALPLKLLLPAHGGPSTRPTTTLQNALAHREERETQLLDALAAGPRTLAELVPEVYRGVPRELWHLARLQLLGNLEKLRDEGGIACRGADVEGPWEKISHRT